MLCSLGELRSLYLFFDIYDMTPAGFPQKKSSRDKLLSQQAEDLVYVHSNYCLLSREGEEYLQGPTKYRTLVVVLEGPVQDPYGP